MNPEEALIYLSSCAVNQTIPEASVLDPVDRDALYLLAVRHQMGSLAAAVLESIGIKDARFTQERAHALRSELVHDEERKAILSALEKAEIWYLPLKGVILKEYYPKLGMRQMSDNDILFDAARAEDVKKLMGSLGYQCTRFGVEHQDDYQKAPVSHFEMHRMLFSEEDGAALSAYYRNVKDRLIKDEGNGYGYHFSDEDFYIYLIAHEYKHLGYGGIGIRALLDIYVFLRRFQDRLDWAYIKIQCDKLGISELEEKSRALALAVFSAGRLGDLTPDQKEMLGYFIESGIYGTKEHLIQNTVKKEGKWRYILQRIFLPMEKIRQYYPFFYRHKIFLVFLPVYRLIRRWKNAKTEFGLVADAKRSGKAPDHDQ